MAKPGKKVKRRSAKTRVVRKKAAPPTLVKPEAFWKSHWLPVLIIAVLATLPYWQSIPYEYVLDDKVVYTENQIVMQGLSGMGDIFGKESFSGFFGGQEDLLVGARYRPLSLATFALEFELWGQDARVSHAINIVFYALTAILLYVVLVYLLSGRKSRSWYFSLPFAAAMLFALHPIHSEVVANVKGRDEIMALLGALGTLYLSWRYLLDKHWKWLAGSSFVFFLALLAKENALTFLAIVPLSLYLFGRADRRQLLMTTLPLLAVSALYLLLRYAVIGYLFSPEGQQVSTNVMNNPFFGLTGGEHLATIFYTLGLYVKLLLFPHPLTHDYYPYQVPIMNWGDWQVLLSLAVQLGLAALAVWAWRRHRVLSYGILFYFITLSIVSNLPFTVGTFMNERFVFMPSVGFALVLGWLVVDRLPRLIKNRGQLIGLLLVAGISTAYLVRTWVRVPDWQNAYTLNLAAAKFSPNSARANLFLAVAIFQREYELETDRDRKLALLNEIEYFLDRAVEILPAYPSAQNFRAGIAAQKYSFTRDIDPILSVFHEVLRYHPSASSVYQNVEWLIDNGAPIEPIVNFAHDAGYDLLGQQMRNYPAAVQLLEYGLRASPNNAQLRQDIGLMYRAAGNEVKAQEYLGN